VAFLRLNGWNLDADQVEAYNATLELTTRARSEAEFAAWIRGRRAPWPQAG
jgi:prophage maintenance system killer protein